MSEAKRERKREKTKEGKRNCVQEGGIALFSSLLSLSSFLLSRFSPVSWLISFKMASNLIYTASSHGSQNMTEDLRLFSEAA